MPTKFLSILQNLDAFGYPISFYLKGKTQYTSSFGGFSTLTILIIMMIISIKLCINLISRANMSSQQYTTYSMSPPHQNLTRNDFIFSLKILDPTITLNNSLFSFSATLMTKGQSNKLLQSLPIELRLCQAEDFSNIVPNNSINIENSLCPANFSYEIFGADGNEKFQELNIVASQCVNGSNLYITCASQEFIDQYFDIMSPVGMRLYFINKYVDLQNITNPFQSFVDEQSWAISPLGQLASSSNLFLRANQFVSYDDILGILSPNIYTSFSFEGERVNHIYVPSKNIKLFAEINVRSSNYQNYYLRSYDDLLSIISFMGGLSHILISSFGFIVGIVNNYEYKMSMVNELYDFDMEEDIIYKNHQERSENTCEILNSSSNFQINKVTDRSKINEKFDRMQSLRRRLIFTFPDFIKYICFCFRSKLSNKRIKLYDLGTIQLAKDMDILGIIKKLQDITKLKNILLYPDKIRIFNFVPPPIISINDRINNMHDIAKLIRKNIITKSRSDQIILFNESDNPFQNLDQYYKNSDIYCMLKKKKDQISQNVIQSLDPEITDIFDSIEEAKNPSNIDLTFQTIDGVPNTETEGSIIIPQDTNQFNGSKLKDLENKVGQFNVQDTGYSQISLHKEISDIPKEKQDIQYISYDA